MEETLAGHDAVVIGGGITGLAATLVLSQRGARVTVLERDPELPTRTASAAFDQWKRAGAPQVRHSHVFLGRLRNLLRDHYPDLLQALLDHGARELRSTERPPAPLHGLPPEPGDDDLIPLAVRRTTFEWVLRRHVLRNPGVRFVAGANVRGLVATPTERPTVWAVRYEHEGAECVLRGHYFIDASGRRSPAPQWLAELGAAAPEERQESSGIVYYTRFYRFRPGASEPPPSEHPTAGDFNFVKYAVFPADDRTFSITLAVPLAFPRLKILAEAAAFDTMVREIPGIAPWVDPAVATPIGEARRPVQAMGGLVNRLRRFVDEQGPLAPRLFVLGDAAYCTNPLYGRGCSQGFLHAHFLAEALERFPGDPRAVALAVDRRARAEIEPFYRASILADRDAVRRAEGRQPKDLAGRLRQRFFEEGVVIAMRCDPVVFRATLRMMNMLETPEQAFGKPEVITRTLWVMARGEQFRRRMAVPPPPDYETTVARCEAALRS